MKTTMLESLSNKVPSLHPFVFFSLLKPFGFDLSQMPNRKNFKFLENFHTLQSQQVW